ncbi:hypothetical protein CNMCM6936_001783 [Aspergillus lentulus]|nr:hypothetical protein CNMCM6936_001783 [Aspergillus lentulus]
MADGLPSHEHDVYPIVTYSRRLGGGTDYNDLDESLSYWSTGWFRWRILPTTSASRARSAMSLTMSYRISRTADGWGRSPVWLGLSQLAEAEAGTEFEGRFLDAMHRYHGTVSGSIIGDERISGLRPEPLLHWTQVRIICETKYPFTQRLVYTVDADGPFDFSVRIPGWSASLTVSANGSPLRGAAPNTRTGMLKILLDQGSSAVIVALSAEVHVQRRANDTVAMYYGNLLYAIQCNTHKPPSPLIRAFRATYGIMSFIRPVPGPTRPIPLPYDIMG